MQDNFNLKKYLYNNPLLLENTLKDEIFKVSKEIINILEKGFDGNKFTFKTKINIDNKELEVRLIINKSKNYKEIRIIGLTGAKGDFITINIKYNGEIKDINDLEDEIKITLKHEIKHYYQIKSNSIKPPQFDQFCQMSYYKEPHEIEAHAEELYLKSELKNTPIEIIIKDFEKHLLDCLNSNTEMAKKTGYKGKLLSRYTGGKKDVDYIIQNIKKYLNKEYNLNLI